MLLIYSLLFVFLLIYFFGDHVKKYSVSYYIVSLLLVLGTIYIEAYSFIADKVQFNYYLMQFERAIRRGILPTAFFIFVMFAGALNSRSKLTQKIIKIRAELAIIGSILMMAHGLVYLIGFILYIPSMLRMGIIPLYIIICVIGTVAFGLMIPLMITSFKKIRRKMKPNKWKKLQKWSYLFYFLIYAHVLIIFLRHKDIEWLDLSLYTGIFGLYTVMRLLKYKKKKP